MHLKKLAAPLKFKKLFWKKSWFTIVIRSQTPDNSIQDIKEHSDYGKISYHHGWLTMPQTRSELMHMKESHSKASVQPNVCKFLKAVITRVNPLFSVPQLSVWYLRIPQLVLVMMNSLEPTELGSESHDMWAWNRKLEIFQYYNFNLIFLLQKLYLKGTTVNIYYDKHFYIKQWNTKERKVLQARSWNNFRKQNNTVLESLRIVGTDSGPFRV